MTDGISLRTRGSVIASDASANYRIDVVGAAEDPDNTLAADSVAAHALTLDAAADSLLALAEGQMFTVGVLGISETGGNLTLSGAGTLAAGSSPFNLSVANAASTLTVGAPLAAVGVVTKNGAGRAALNGGYTGVSTFAVNGGTLAVKNDADADLAPLLQGVGAFEKTGAGALTVKKASPNLSGDVVVKEGTLRFGATGSLFPDGTGVLRIESGAALDVATSDLATETVNLGARKVVVSGAGPDGKGAIVQQGGKSQYNALRNGELAGDAVFGGGGATLSASIGRWDFRSGSFAMNGHNIEKVGKNMVCFTGMNLTEGGPVRIDVKDGYWSSETTTSYSGGAANVFDIYGGAWLDLYNMSLPITWSINLRDGAGINIRNGSSTQNVFSGPVNVASGTANINAAAGYYGTISGKVSGEGRIKSVSGGGGRISFTNPANDWAGGLFVSGGDVYVASKGSLPGYDDASKLTVSNGTLIVNYTDGAWRAADVQAIANQGSLVTSGSFLGLQVDGTETLDTSLNFALGGLSRYGAGTLTITQPQTLQRGRFYIVSGTNILDGVDASVSSFDIRKAMLVLTNGASLHVSVASGSESVLGGATRAIGEIVVNEGSELAGATDCPVDAASADISVGSSDNGIGVLTVNGGTVRHKLMVGNGNVRAQGAVIQNGGIVEDQGGASNDIRIGNDGYGYYELNDGTFSWWGYGTIGGSYSTGIGVMHQHGGTFKFLAKTASRFGLSRGGWACFYMDGGLVDFTAGSSLLALGEQDNNGTGVGSQSVFTLDGPNAEARFGNRSTQLGNRRDHTAVINLNNGGTLECGQFVANATFDSTNRSTLVSLLNFNGGVYRAPASLSFYPENANKKPDAVTVYPQGAVFDVPENRVLTMNAPLRRPEGQGVAAITAPDALFSAANYVGAPIVKITGGGGRGATAICTYDSKTRKVTGVKVTSPGTGYTSAPTVQITGGGYTNLYTGTATLAPNSAMGGLVKRGAGRMVLVTPSTFGGAVTVEEGTLQTSIADALPQGFDLVLDGGTFDGFGQVLTAGVVTVRSGTLANVQLFCTALQKIGDGRFTLDGASVSPATPSAFGSGLYCGRLSGAFNLTDPNPCTSVVKAPDKANTTAGWGQTETYVYTGYLWNRSTTNVTWTFAEYFDDSLLLRIDGQSVLSNTTWNTLGMGTVTLKPGPHAFELRLGQGTGGAGPSTAPDVASWTSTLGLGVDFQGRGKSDLANFEKLEDRADIDELFSLSAGSVNILGGDVEIVRPDAVGQPGLFEDILSGAKNWSTVPPHTGGVELTTTRAHSDSKTVWATQTTTIYSGYLWVTNESDVTWTFVEDFDDYARVQIDGVTIIDDGVWNVAAHKTITLSPGPHRFEARFGQDGGDPGPHDHGIAGFWIDFAGHDSNSTAYRSQPTDPGDGTLFTTSLPAPNGIFAELEAVGSFVGDLPFRGILNVHAADLLNGDHVSVSGAFAIQPGATINLTDAAMLRKGGAYVIVEAAGGIVGDTQALTVNGIPEGTPWGVYRKGNSLVLAYPSSTVIYIR